MIVLPKQNVLLDDGWHMAHEPFELEMVSIPLDLQNVLVELKEVKEEAPASTSKPSRRSKKGVTKAEKSDKSVDDFINTISTDSYLDELL